jgi:voltage-gated potassium channel
MPDLPRKIYFDILLLVVVVLIGTTGYHLIEHWTLFESLYMTVITLTTIGFGELHPLSVTGRIFTLFLILGGIGAITYTVGSLSTYFFGENIYNFVRGRRMKEKITRLKNHYIICGASEVGLAVVEEMVLEKVPVLLIDRSEEKLQLAAQKYKCFVLLGDATKDGVLKTAQIDKAAGLVATFGNDHENVYLIMTARQLSKHIKIFAKVKEEETENKLRLAGADQVINPYKIGGLRLASTILRPHAVKLMDEFVRDPKKLRVEELVISEKNEFYKKSLTIEQLEKKLQVRVIAFRQFKNDSYQYLFDRSPITFHSGDALFFLQAKN